MHEMAAQKTPEFARRYLRAIITEPDAACVTENGDNDGAAQRRHWQRPGSKSETLVAT